MHSPRRALLSATLLLAGTLCIAGTSHAAARRDVVIIGDSTSLGSPPPSGGVQSPYEPGATLAMLLRMLEPTAKRGGTPWRRAKVHNLAVGASNSEHWLASPPAGCGTLLEAARIVQLACAAGTSWIDTIASAVPTGAEVYIVHLGINDLLVTSNPIETVDRLEEIAARLAPVPVLFFPPVGPPDGPRGNWPQLVRQQMELRGLFLSPSYPKELPTHDGLHPTHGSYGALGALWLDALRALP